VAHSTTLGQGSVPSILLAERLARLSDLQHVLYSDSGSTAVEAAIKIALQYFHQNGEPERTGIASLEGAYHGDTLGAVAAAPVPAFHAAFKDFLGDGPVQLPFPDTYRGPHPGDDAATRDWALGKAQEILARHGKRLAVLIVEPMVQGVGGMRAMPKGYLAGLRALCDEHGVLLVADEVATGFGRTGKMFACHHEDVLPDLMAVGKGLSGGYLPLAATLASDAVFQGFMGRHEESRQLFHGHSFTGNQLGCAAALANIALLEPMLADVQEKSAWLDTRLAPWRDIPIVGNVTGLGFMRGVELVADKSTKEPFAATARAAQQVYLEAKARGMLARPYGNTGLFLPPLATPRDELATMSDLYEASLRAAARRLSPSAGIVLEVPR
ncbi:MAG: aspartate aminotransferase family protein, partial [Thermoplasmatota archaeon]